MASVSEMDPYDAVRSRISSYGAGRIPVPALSQLLGVKPTTLNARFRRERIPVRTIGRTNYVPQALALELAAMHRYALIGWPTLLDASRITAVKPGTLKARCEKGQLEGYIDLTKRLRVNPDELGRVLLLLRKPGVGLRPGDRHSRRDLQKRARKSRSLAPAEPQERSRFPIANGATSAATATFPQRAAQREKSFLPPAPEPKIGIIRPEDYGFSDLVGSLNHREPPPAVSKNGKVAPGYLVYDPLRPFSISVCSPGKTIRYGQHTGTILELLEDPYTPTIKVAFPDHQHPAMREVLLVVDRRNA